MGPTSPMGGGKGTEKGSETHGREAYFSVLALLGQEATSLSKGHVHRVTPEGPC